MAFRRQSSWFQQAGARSWRCRGPGREAMGFHSSWPGYEPTPLVEAPGLAEALEVARVCVKDESSRLGMPAFKVLGASWAVFRAFSERVGGRVPVTFEDLAQRTHEVSPVELVTATDGNHGQAVAYVARLLSLPCEVFVPRSSVGAVVAIEREGAVVTVVDGPYDEAVRRAADVAQRRAPYALLVQDTAWPGYQEMPGWIVEGYSTLFWEIEDQLGEVAPGLVAIPIGVGSLAQAGIAHFRGDKGTAAKPALLGVEPESAACVLESLLDGGLVTVRTADTVMTGLNCGTPSTLAWPYLRYGLDAAVAVTDDEAMAAVTDLATAGISSGPAGAAALAGARVALTGPGAGDRRAMLGIHGRSTVVLLATEAGAPA